MGGMIVVIEDEPDVLDLLRDLLTLEGLGVVGIGDPQLIETLVPGLHPDLFLIDIMLPGMSGLELAEQLRRAGFTDIPMIAMSASRRMLQVATDSGLFISTIRMPFDLSDLLECIRLHLSHARTGE